MASSWNMVENDALFRAVSTFGTNWHAILNSSGYGCLLKGRDPAALDAQWRFLKSMGSSRKLVQAPQSPLAQSKSPPKKLKKKAKKSRTALEPRMEPFSSSEKYKVLRGMEIVGWGRWKDLLSIYKMRRSPDMLRSFAVSLILAPLQLDLTRVCTPSRSCRLRSWVGSSDLSNASLCFLPCPTADPCCFLAVDRNLFSRPPAAPKDDALRKGSFAWVLTDSLPPWPAVTIRASDKVKKEKKRRQQAICFGTFELISTSKRNFKPFKSLVTQFHNFTAESDGLDSRSTNFLKFSNAVKLLADKPRVLDIYKKSIMDAAGAWLERKNFMASKSTDEAIEEFFTTLKAEEHLLRNITMLSKKGEKFRIAPWVRESSGEPELSTSLVNMSCECGISVSREELEEHRKSQKHADLLAFCRLMNVSSQDGINEMLGERFKNSDVAEDIKSPKSRQEEAEALKPVNLSMCKPVVCPKWEEELLILSSEIQRREAVQHLLHEQADRSHPATLEELEGNQSVSLKDDKDIGQHKAKIARIEALTAEVEGEKIYGAYEVEGRSGMEERVVYGCRPCRVVNESPRGLRLHLATQRHLYKVRWMRMGWISINGEKSDLFPSNRSEMYSRFREKRFRIEAKHSNRHCAKCRKLGLVVCCDTCPRVLHLSCIPADIPLPRSAWQRDVWSCERCSAANMTRTKRRESQKLKPSKRLKALDGGKAKKIRRAELGSKRLKMSSSTQQLDHVQLDDIDQPLVLHNSSCLARQVSPPAGCCFSSQIAGLADDWLRATSFFSQVVPLLDVGNEGEELLRFVSSVSLEDAASFSSDMAAPVVAWLLDLCSPLNETSAEQKEGSEESRANSQEEENEGAEKCPVASASENVTWQTRAAGLMRRSFVADEMGGLASDLEEGKELPRGAWWKVVAFLCDESCSSPAVRFAMAKYSSNLEAQARRRRMEVRKIREVKLVQEGLLVEVLDPQTSSWLVMQVIQNSSNKTFRVAPLVSQLPHADAKAGVGDRILRLSQLGSEWRLVSNTSEARQVPGSGGKGIGTGSRGCLRKEALGSDRHLNFYWAVSGSLWSCEHNRRPPQAGACPGRVWSRFSPGESLDALLGYLLPHG
ncbi:hypothetical protein GUITHDRAFT_135414 [Guillardia theta CCMP2712]|uniref:PHD-type domain-containing protein n=1 Tax=Guillardia theta (strain CCMP2712) TaxID=905079 RepID=L1JP72_GUITC|nr:hypothetical protein GUITHDRAFT_135414 [Guillardia theta CCMP2712]EKX50252.1 hypothetical protein GUITHDRAFT_135414 [Guillardia theta CCMP2712]|eukprot:XP_005837232.1 hypothetical protein GUITHDRAFT_135414 [Guillardia theta CCMP2712]